MDFTNIVQAFGGLTHMIVFLIIALSIIVAIHEYGHYIVGRWCGIHAEVFSIGFGPVIYSRTDKRGTKWQIAILPLGGFVKFLGDSDAASGKDGEAVAALSDTERRRSMHGAPLWARSATVFAGPLFNFISAILIFAGVFWYQGEVKDDLVVKSTIPLPESFTQELLPGDTILAINGKAIPKDRSGFISDLPKDPVLEYGILRDGQEMTVSGPHPSPSFVGGLIPRHPAADIDMRINDVVTAVDGVAVYTFYDMRDAIISKEGKPVLLDVWRDGELLQFSLKPQITDLPRANGTFETGYRIGVYPGTFFEPETQNIGIIAAFKMGIQRVIDIVAQSLNALWNIATGAISTCNLNGPVGIAQASSQLATQGSQVFISFIGVLSVAVGFLNLFPIPVLDGGHLVFHAYEAVRGKPPNDKVLNYLMMAGLAIMLSFMTFALTNDIFCP